MQPVSSWFMGEPANSPTSITYARAYKAGVPVLNLAGTPMILYPIGGSVVIDRTAESRRSLTAEFAPVDEWGTDLIPTPGDPTSPLSIYGTELRIFMGWQYRDVNPETGSRVEVVSVGRFRIKRSGGGESGGTPTVGVSGFDSSWALRTPVRSPTMISAGTELGIAFGRVLHAKDPTLDVDAIDTGFVLPSEIVLGLRDNPWKIAGDIAAVSGSDRYFDVTDRATMTPTVTRAAQSSVFSFVEGDGAFFAETEHESDAEDSPNVITMIGNSAGSASGTATVADEDPNSPTFVGTYGEIHETFESSMIGSNSQALRAAQARLTLSIAAHDQIRFSSIRMPCLDVDDTISITRARLKLLNRKTVIERIELPLAEGLMQIDARRVPADLNNAA